MTLSEELTWRGFVNQTTFKNLEALDGQPMTFYWGVDPSADSMTVGNLAAAMMVRHFIDHGHKAILLVGGATGLIGDPDGKNEERTLKTSDEIASNKAEIVAQYKQVFAGQHFEQVDNYDWFKDINYLEFLRDIGKHLSMTQLLDREFVQSRIGEGGRGISYAEFSYSLIQGYDFLHLSREKGVTLQVCGADQWGNCLAGVEMIRKIDGKEAHVWSTPLIMNKATGKKFGKYEEGAVWLSEQKTSVYQFYQFWLNCDDHGVADYLKVYTLLPKDEIDRLEAAAKENPGARDAQKALSYEVTKLVHGQERADSVRRVSEVLFGGHSISELTNADLDALSAEIPTASSGVSVISALVDSGLATSNGEAQRLITSNAISINGQKINHDHAITDVSLLKKGKNGFVLVR
jgi:tyrosyl-tRNA synthetase